MSARRTPGRLRSGYALPPSAWLPHPPRGSILLSPGGSIHLSLDTRVDRNDGERQSAGLGPRGQAGAEVGWCGQLLASWAYRVHPCSPNAGDTCGFLHGRAPRNNRSWDLGPIRSQRSVIPGTNFGTNLVPIHVADPHTNRRRSSIAGATRMPSGVR